MRCYFRSGAIVIAFAILSLLLTSGCFAFLASPSSSAFSESNAQTSLANSNTTVVSQPIYIWFFGYIGNTFWPQTTLNLNQANLINAAKNLSLTFGRQNLVLMTAVDEIPARGGTITNNTANISAIKSYVAELHKYAAAVYGRLDFYQFNLTATSYGNCHRVSGEFPDYNCPIYNQSRLMINQLGLDGIWFDHDIFYYDKVKNVTFNLLMQNLTSMFSPREKFILNETPAGTKNGFITELSGFTWENETYVSPSPGSTQTLAMPLKKVKEMNAAFPGHVIAHLDAEGPPHLIGSLASEPMSEFAALPASQEMTALNSLVYNSTHPADGKQDEAYGMVIPFLGAWTFNGALNCTLHPNYSVSCSRHVPPNYQGTLYNAWQSGKFARNTAKGIEQLLRNDTPTMAMSPNKGPAGTLVKVDGTSFIHSRNVSIIFEGAIVNQTTSSSDGDFSLSFIAEGSIGNQNLTATDSINYLNANFTITAHN
jgi:hypothetical protein